MSGAPRLVIGFHSYGSCPTHFALDLARCMRYSGTLIPYALHEQSCYVDSARNKLVRNFLAGDGTHLLMIDVDIAFEPHYPLLTLQILQGQQADAVYGNYALGNSGNSIFGAPDNAAQEAAVLVNLQHNHIYRDVATGGTGWIMMTRTLLERMQKECPGPWHWFARDPTADGSDLRGEDISFGLRVWGLNPRPQVVGTTAMVLRHLKLQPFIPAFQQNAASALGLSALCFPNPYENNPEFLVSGNRVLKKSQLPPEQLALLEKEMEDAKREREAAQVHGGGASPKAEGQEDQNRDEGKPA